MSCGVSLMVNPLKWTTANICDFDFKDLRNSSVISSSWPCSLSQNDIQCARENKSTNLGVSYNFLEFEGSFLMNPPIMVKTVFGCSKLTCSCTERELWGFSTQSVELCLCYVHVHIEFIIFFYQWLWQWLNFNSTSERIPHTHYDDNSHAAIRKRLVISWRDFYSHLPTPSTRRLHHLLNQLNGRIMFRPTSLRIATPNMNNPSFSVMSGSL